MPDKTRKLRYGFRRQVFNGNAEMTSGGLRKDDLIKNGRGRIVSTKKHSIMKKRAENGFEFNQTKEPKPAENGESVQEH
jgi:hypothetical protein